ncbi:MAG TPA: hypothetical protein VHU15_18500 [Stellaceae bacterium]|jgi:hypothetical protein|nr:hypothetical protein [Stellaceae bacterium]
MARPHEIQANPNAGAPVAEGVCRSAGRGLAGTTTPRHFAAMSDDRNDDDGNDSRRRAMIGLVVVAVLVVIGYFLMTTLRQNANLEDCLMSGRHNCAPIEVPSGSR